MARMTGIRAFAAAMVVAAPLGMASKAEAATMVGLELVLLVDVSGSVDASEYALQKGGYVQAFQSAAVQNAIMNSQLGSIAVTYVEWSGAAQQAQLVNWTLVNDAAGKAWLLRSSDGGQSWTVPAPAPGARVSDLAFGDARRGWAVGEQGAIWATTDGGLNWQAQASGRTQTLRAVSALDGRTVWAAGDGGTLLASATGGR